MRIGRTKVPGTESEVDSKSVVYARASALEDKGIGQAWGGASYGVATGPEDRACLGSSSGATARTVDCVIVEELSVWDEEVLVETMCCMLQV